MTACCQSRVNYDCATRRDRSVLFRGTVRLNFHLCVVAREEYFHRLGNDVPTTLFGRGCRLAKDAKPGQLPEDQFNKLTSRKVCIWDTKPASIVHYLKIRGDRLTSGIPACGDESLSQLRKRMLSATIMRTKVIDSSGAEKSAIEFRSVSDLLLAAAFCRRD